MKPIEYLRALARRERTLATGGIVTAKDAAVEIRIDNSQTGRFTAPTGPAYFKPAPTAVIAVDAKLTEQQMANLRNLISVNVRTSRTPSADKNCGCWPRYSYCACKH